MNKTFYRINSDFEIEKIVEESTQIILTEASCSKWFPAAPVRLINMISSGVIGTGIANDVIFSADQKSTVAILRVGWLPLRANFMIDTLGVLTPDFMQTCKNACQMTWQPPDDMELLFVVKFQSRDIGWPTSYESQFLVARNDAGNTFRMPLSNLHEDCALCAGTFESTGPTYVDVLARCWKQFNESSWQRDLSNSTIQTSASQLFRFKALSPDGFQQLPSMQHWEKCCFKMNNEFLNRFIQ